MKKYIFVTIIVILVLLIGITLIMFGRKKTPDKIDHVVGMINNEAVGLYCPAESEEEAMRIAVSYSIILDYYNEGIAVFSIPDGRTAMEVISYGEENGLPLLVVNSTQSIK